MDTTEQYAAEFIAKQKARFELDGVTGATRRQRARMAALDVVSPEERWNAIAMANTNDRVLGRPPHGDSGRMRVVNMHTGEIRIQRAPALRHDFEAADVIDEAQTAAL